MKKQKVILDTDIGDDFDDANALGLLLASPEIDLIGVVVDYGNTPERAKVACRMLYEVGREDVPVVVGRQTDDPFTRAHFYTKQFHWGEGFDKKKPIEQSAADFIIAQLHKYPGEIILLTIAPVTNFQDVLEKEPDVLKMAKKVVSMFGSFYMGYSSHPLPCAEWNVKADIPASQQFSASGANIVYAGLDVTVFVRLKKEFLQQFAYRNSPLTDAILALFTLSSIERKDPEPIIYDSVTAGMILWPDLFKTRKAFVRVDDDGFTIIDESKAPNCEIAVSVDVGEFFNRYMDRMLTQNLMRK
jgi:inosine-uridine nucleoside N-ribohydrolase